ncbi:MAG: SAM-dependent methyltransferase, partial [Chitinophagales bacterium]|nr:SAM-dependent methyltransferase [Chitinophagales bacterium]
MYSRKPVKTSDGSSTIFIPELNESYHSIHGALTESQHVFIENGFKLLKQDKVKVLEVGFGTGLNALLTLVETCKNSQEVNYCALEPYPLELELIVQVGYDKLVQEESIRKVYYSW